ncbi:MAG: methyltransferase domain-containing protein, partial [Bacteroidetes bacterium]|nr:methyltransferase domain-containing protein [Bacteroidota bacterium]
MANLTDRNFWANYWKNHAYQKVGNEVFYSPLIRTQNGESKKFIELGGFPGYGCVYFKKELGYEVSIFDFYIDKTIVNKVEEVNGLPIGTIECIEGDLFAYTAKSEYDFVISLGLIEHFDDTKDIIARHLSFMKEDGELLIMLPNFRGLNGWVQRTF